MIFILYVTDMTATISLKKLQDVGCRTHGSLKFVETLPTNKSSISTSVDTNGINLINISFT